MSDVDDRYHEGVKAVSPFHGERYHRSSLLVTWPQSEEKYIDRNRKAR